MYVYTRRRVLPGEVQLKVELVCSFTQATVAAQYDLILEKRGKAIAIVSTGLVRFPGYQGGVVIPVSFAWVVWALVDLSKAMEADNDMGYVHRLGHLQHYATGDNISGAVLTMGIIRLNVEL
jgi:hypothetical protein